MLPLKRWSPFVASHLLNDMKSILSAFLQVLPVKEPYSFFKVIENFYIIIFCRNLFTFSFFTSELLFICHMICNYPHMRRKCFLMALFYPSRRSIITSSIFLFADIECSSIPGYIFS